MTIPITLGVIGGGVVGRAVARAFIEHVTEVRVHDVQKERATHSLAETLACDLVHLCLPTPQMKGGLACDTSALEDFLNMLGGSAPGGRYVIRSTVPVGFTRRMREQYGLVNLCHSPEFLTARVACTDAQLPARNVIGSPKDAGRLCDCARLLDDLYRRRFPGVPVHLMTSDESEFVKLAQNSLFASKIAEFNELHAFAESKGLEWKRVLAAILADGRISHSHTRVPGPDGRFGFGGECLVKDLANLIDCMQQAGVGCEVLTGAHERNKRDRLRPAEGGV